MYFSCKHIALSLADGPLYVAGGNYPVHRGLLKVDCELCRTNCFRLHISGHENYKVKCKLSWDLGTIAAI